MTDHLLNYLKGNRCDVSAGARATEHVAGVTNGCRNNFRGDVRVQSKHADDVVNQCQTVFVDVDETPDKRGDVGGAGQRSEQSLIGAENQRAVGGDARRGENLDGFQTFGGHRNLNNHMCRINGVDFAAFLDHALCIDRGGLYFAGNRAVNDRADFLQRFGIIAAFFGDQARIGRDATDNAHFICQTDFVYIGSVEKQFHFIHLFLSFSCRTEAIAADILPLSFIPSVSMPEERSTPAGEPSLVTRTMFDGLIAPAI